MGKKCNGVCSEEKNCIACPKYYDPVCDVSMQTYYNMCILRRKGVDLKNKYPGLLNNSARNNFPDAYSPVCDVNCTTNDNEGLLQCKGLSKTDNCACPPNNDC